MHSIDDDLSTWLPARNLALAIPGRPLLTACPSCYDNLKLAHLNLQQNEEAHELYRKIWGQPYNPDLQIITFFDLVSDLMDSGVFKAQNGRLNGLKLHRIMDLF